METVATGTNTDTQSDLPITTNAMSALGYFCGIAALAALFIKPYDKDKQVRFHAVQALLFHAFWVVSYVALAIVTMILSSIATFLLGSLKLYSLLGALLTIPTTVSLLFSLGMVAIWTVLIVASAQGKMIKLPVLAKFAEQQANR